MPKKKTEPKFKQGDIVKVYNEYLDQYYDGRVATVITNVKDGIVYGVVMDWDMAYHLFPESRLIEETGNEQVSDL